MKIPSFLLRLRCRLLRFFDSGVPKTATGLISSFHIEALEPRIVLSSSAIFTDSDGDLFTVKVSGPGGADVVQLAGIDQRGPIDSITLHDTSAKSMLSISVKTPKGGSGDGEVTVGTITGTVLQGIKAPGVDLIGAGLLLDSPLSRLSLHDLRNGSDIHIGGAPTNKSTIRLGEVGDGSDVINLSAISALTAEKIGNGSVVAPLIGKLGTTKGGLAADLTVAGALGSIAIKGGNADGVWTAASFSSISVIGGDYRASLTATASLETLGKKFAVGKVTVTGGNFAGDLSALGSIGSVTVSSKGGGGMLVGATLTAKNFGKIAVAGNVMQSVVLAGANLGNDHALGGTGSAADTFGAGSIKSFVVKGTVGAMTVVGAGLKTTDQIFGNSDDMISPDGVSRIGKFSVGGAMDDSYFRAGVFSKSVLIGGNKVDPLSDPRFKSKVSVDTTAPVIAAALANDTGVSARDGISSEATVAGSITDASAIMTFRAGFGNTPAASFADVSGSLSAGGVFTLSSALLEEINGAPLADGKYTLHLQATDGAGNSSTVVDVTFTVDTAAPSFTLSPTDGMRDVLPREVVFVIFDEPVFVGTQSASGFTPDTTDALTLDAAQGTAVPGRVVLDGTGVRLTFVPTTDLPGNTQLTATFDPSKVFDLAGNAAFPVEQQTQFQTANSLGIPATKVVGFVFDSAPNGQGQNVPLAGATVRVANAPAIETVTDANGRFELTDTPAGKLMIDVDGHTVPVPPGSFYPAVAEVIEAAAGQTNTFGAPVFLPLAHNGDFVTINNTPGATTMVSNPDELPGWQLMVPGGAVERRDGSMANKVLIAPVPPNRLPAPLPAGMTPPIVFTVQTEGGADVFTQPVPLTAPNLDGLAPGEKTVLWDFDHARGKFVPVATATASADGATIQTDPGQGVVRPGWHFLQALTNITSNVRNGKDPKPGLNLGDLGNMVGLIVLDVAALGGDIPFPTPLPLKIIGTAAGLLRSAVDQSTVDTLVGFEANLASNFQLESLAKTLVEEAKAGVREAINETINGLQNPAGSSAAKSHFQNAETALRTSHGLQNLGKLANAAGVGLNLFGLYNDSLRLGKDITDLQQAILDPPGDLASQMLASMEELQARILDFGVHIGNALERNLTAIDDVLEVAVIATSNPPETPLAGDLKTAVTDALNNAEAAANASGDLLASLKDELAGMKEEAARFGDIAAPSATGRVFFKFTGTAGASSTGNGFGSVTVPLAPGSSGTLIVVDPQAGTIGQATITAPPLSAGAADVQGPPVILFPSTAGDANANGLSDDLEAIISNTPLSAQAVQDLKNGVDLSVAGLSITGTIARVATFGTPTAVVTGPNIGYVGTSASGVDVFDLTRPSNPSALGTIPVSGTPSDLSLRGDHLAVGSILGFVDVFDVSRPDRAFRILQLPGEASDVPSVSLGANHVIFNKLGTLRSVNLLTGQQSGQLPLPGTGAVQDVLLTNDIVFAVRNDAAAHSITLASAALNSDGTLTLLDSLAIPNAAAGQRANLAGGDGVLFISDVVAAGQSSPGFASVNIANPSDLQLIAAPSSVMAHALEVTGSSQGVAIGSNPAAPSLLVFDLSNAADTTNLQKSIATFSQDVGVAVGNGIALAASSGGTLDVVRFAATDSAKQPPNAAISGLTAGSVLKEGERVSLHVAATDDVQVQRVELLFQGNNVLASDTSYPFDLDLPVPIALPNGQTVTVAARVIDTAGNTTVTTPLSLTFAANPLHIIGASPAPGAATQLAVSTITLDFDKAVDRARPTAADFILRGAGPDAQFDTADDVTVPVTGVRFSLDAKKISLSLAAPLPIDSYRLTAPAAKLTDRGGNLLDGEFGGTFPSGDGNFGGDFTYGFTAAAKISSLFPIPLVPSGGRSPGSLVTADFDGDGHADLATTNENPGNVGLLFGIGQGSFAPAQTLDNLPGVAAIAAGDLDGDGKPDLLVSYNPVGGSKLAVFRNAGDGTFAAAIVIDFPSSSLGEIALADFNGDGRLDVFLKGSPSAVLLNNGSGGLGAPMSPQFNGALAIADVNKDGKLDVFAGDGMYLGNGDGTFARGPSFSSSDGVNYASLLDVTNDGNLDLIYSSGSGPRASLNVAGGLGDGRFGVPTTLPTNDASTLNVVDINGDGRPDAILTGALGVTVFTGISGGSFAPGLNYSAPLQAAHVVVGDWDSDGQADLAATGGNDAIALVFGKSGGAFAGVTETVVKRTPGAAVAGDINNDGKLDVVTIDRATGNSERLPHTMTAYLGNGADDFTKAITTDLGVVPSAIALADVNADGKLDVATASANDHSVLILLGAGDGSFGAPARFAIADSPQSVQLADVNADGRVDVVVGGGASISVLLGSGNGGFATPTQISEPNTFVLTSDLNGDGRQDLVSAFLSEFFDSRSLTIRLANADGSFGAPNEMMVFGLSGVALADVNKDGKVDLITGDTGLNERISVRLGIGDGTFAAPTTTTLTDDADKILVADVTRDGNPDLLVGAGFSSVSLLRGNGDGTFNTPVAVAVGPLFLAADFGADTNPDLLIGESDSLGLRPNTGSGTFGPAKQFAAGANPKRIVVGDLNGDGKLDAVAADPSADTVSVLLGLGGGAFAPPTDFRVGDDPVALRLADLNNDGHLDVVTANLNGANLSVLLGSGNGDFAPAVSLGLGVSTPLPIALAIGDLNADGKQDLVSANSGSKNVSVLLGNGDGTFGAASLFAIAPALNNASPTDLSLGDVNGDGDLDIVTINSTRTTSILPNNGNGSFGPATQLNETNFSTHLALGDVNGDGRVDLVTTQQDNSGNGLISIRLNNGNGSFGAATFIAPPLFFATSIALADVTRDGKLDMVTFNSSLGGFSIFLNTGNALFEMPRTYAAFFSTEFTVADLNADGKPDLAATDGSGLVLVSLNAG